MHSAIVCSLGFQSSGKLDGELDRGFDTSCFSAKLLSGVVAISRHFHVEEYNPSRHDGKVWCLETEIRGVPIWGAFIDW